MLVQLVYGLLSGISITFLKNDYGPFTHVVQLGELMAAAFVPPVDEVLAKPVPL
jgi:hypothetical protein